MGDSMSKQGEKRSTSRNNIFMKEYMVLIRFLPFLASIGFLGPFWNFLFFTFGVHLVQSSLSAAAQLYASKPLLQVVYFF